MINCQATSSGKVMHSTFDEPARQNHHHLEGQDK
jgi:hypothetical protein